MASTTDLINNLNANISWYKLHSNYNDSTYQSQVLAYHNVIANMPRTNFALIYEVTNVIDMSPILKYGTYECSAPGKEAYLDSAISCALFQLPYFLENIQFGYLCGLVIIPIMLISLFGKIKESYRWFILNQAIFDAFTCYSFICEKPSTFAWSGANYLKYSTCFYSGRSTNAFMDNFFMIIKGAFRNAPYIPLFLLAFSRCISLYFPKFYQRHNKTWKILAFILIFDVVVIFLSSFCKLYNRILQFIQGIGYQNCFTQFCPEFQNYTTENSICFIKNEKFFQCKNEWSIFYDKYSTGGRLNSLSVTPAMVCIVIICVFALFIKISIQLKYQLKHNRHAFIKTTKIAAVIFIQSITLSIYFALMTLQQYLYYEADLFYYFDSRNYQSLPYGIFLLQSFATTTSYNIIRIFFDSFVVLIVLSGYRKRFFDFLFTFYKNPHFIQHFKNCFQHNHRTAATASSMTVVKSVSTTKVLINVK